MTASQTVRDLPPDELEAGVWEQVDGGAALLGGTANVIMQLSRAPVGHGVVESEVDSGNVMLHPAKRLRTTLTYIAVALAGTPEERRRYRDAVNRAHAHVHTQPHSPVEYNAFDPELQRWVAACLYVGAIDLHERMHGPMDEAEAVAWYRAGARFGTTLQMPEEMWPADRAAFADYWEQGLSEASIDATIGAYFDDLLDLRMLPAPVAAAFRGFHRFVSTGLLPEELRDQLELAWTARDARRHRRLFRTVGAVSRRLPGVLRRFPLNACLWDARRRMRHGGALV